MKNIFASEVMYIKENFVQMKKLYGCIEKKYTILEIVHKIVKIIIICSWWFLGLIFLLLFVCKMSQKKTLAVGQTKTT